MTPPRDTLSLSFIPAMNHVDPGEWNALLGGAPPFMRWEWLDLLETSGAVGPHAGWLPAHCLARHGEALLGAAPLYVKTHGAGEFVYDQFWADVAERLGVPYYPKLVAAAPFTPVSGYRFLAAPGVRGRTMAQAILAGCARLAEANSLSGLHVLFPSDDFADTLQGLGLPVWEHQSFLWENKGYASFEDFLGVFKAGQRKNIRRERERLREAGVSVRVVEGVDAPEEWFPLMHDYYEDTNAKFGEWGCKFLPRAFFQGLADRFRHRLAFAAAFEPGREHPLGLALLVHDGQAESPDGPAGGPSEELAEGPAEAPAGGLAGGRLYGRYWGAAREVPFLHFELCYYAPIEYAIARGMASFDPGMGGEHKPRRGFDSRVTRSAHMFLNPALAGVFARNIAQVNALTREYVDELAALSAYKKGLGEQP